MNQMINNSVQQLMREVIQRVAVGPDRGRDISACEAEQVMEAILQGQIDDVQIAVFLIALRMKRESLDEFKGIFSALQKNVKTAQADVEELICLADPFDGYVRHLPMSPFLPAVIAACGMPTLLHGVATVGPKHGITACKVYKLAGLDTDLESVGVANSLTDLGWGYIDQSQYAQPLFSLNHLRDRIVKRTAITTLERLLMPIKARHETHLVLGYVHNAYPQIYAAIAQLSGYDSALLIKGVEGGLTSALNKPLRRHYFAAPNFVEIDFSNDDDLGQNKQVIELTEFQHSTVAAQQSNTHGEIAVQECLTLGIDVLSGRRCIARDSLSLAAGQILWAHNLATSLSDGIQQVGKCLDSGKAKSKFNMSS
jgi:anthranilate phosphoribosyltransferase